VHFHFLLNIFIFLLNIYRVKKPMKRVVSEERQGKGGNLNHQRRNKWAFMGIVGNKNHRWMELDGRNLSSCIFPVLKDRPMPGYLEVGGNRYGRRIVLWSSLRLGSEMVRLQHSCNC